MLKITNGKDSTPDFTVINKYKRVSILSEIKSSINDRPSDPKKQLSNSNNISGLGIQVKFNSEESPVEIILKYPVYSLEGSIIFSVYTNIAILESLLKLEEKDIVSLKNPQWAKEIVSLFEGLEKLNINELIVDDYLYTGIDVVDNFFSLYFDYQEDGSKGLEKVFKV
ncbi:hypothetical protein KM885_08355 [Oceanobacillus caeni]|uniref:hypothetical protein n=1 Tax=Oceanobacillus caeni TaxID=405946 RepID=UPI001C24C2E5|nr:hypothetical protein [Oceanobacillus caeni]MBU8790801.1 hypothetical protein [Oceanobacillus caeni]